MATPVRNIDFEALRSLRDRHGAIYPRGRVIFRQGDTSAEIYVVLQGSVEISIRDAATGVKKVLKVYQAGELFGEMSCFGGLPRSATAIVFEDNTVLLQFTQDSAIQLLRASPRFALGIIQSLGDRIRASNEQIAQLSANNGPLSAAPASTVPGAAGPEGATATRPAVASSGRSPLGASAESVAAAASAAMPAGHQPTPRDFPVPDYDRNQYVPRTVVCPVSNTRFAALGVRPDAAQVKSRESDGHETVVGPSLLRYAIHVCPECLYAAYAEDFGSLSPDESQKLAARTAARKKIVDGRPLTGERSAEDAELAFRLAIDCYTQRPSNLQRLGGLFHRMAWLAREAKDAAAEQQYLRDALTNYIAAVEKERPAEPLAELHLLYTVGDVYLRLGMPTDGAKWLAQASQHAEFKKFPDIQRSVRERWMDARAAARPKAT